MSCLQALLQVGMSSSPAVAPATQLELTRRQLANELHDLFPKHEVKHRCDAPYAILEFPVELPKQVKEGREFVRSVANALGQLRGAGISVRCCIQLVPNSTEHLWASASMLLNSVMFWQEDGACAITAFAYEQLAPFPGGINVSEHMDVPKSIWDPAEQHAAARVHTLTMTGLYDPRNDVYGRIRADVPPVDRQTLTSWEKHGLAAVLRNHLAASRSAIRDQAEGGILTCDAVLDVLRCIVPAEGDRWRVVSRHEDEKDEDHFWCQPQIEEYITSMEQKTGYDKEHGTRTLVPQQRVLIWSDGTDLANIARELPLYERICDLHDKDTLFAAHSRVLEHLPLLGGLRYGVTLCTNEGKARYAVISVPPRVTISEGVEGIKNWLVKPKHPRQQLSAVVMTHGLEALANEIRMLFDRLHKGGDAKTARLLK